MAGRSHKAVAMQTLLVVLPCTAVVAAAAYRRGLHKGAARAGEVGSRASVVRGGVREAEDEEEEVERVLSVWFDGSIADNHRTKWFAQV